MSNPSNAGWRKSTRSQGQGGGDCVEVSVINETRSA